MTGIKLEVGKRYVRRNGALRKINAENYASSPVLRRFYDEFGATYVSDGRCPRNPGTGDLVSEHVEPAPEAGAIVPVGWRMRCVDPALARQPSQWVLLFVKPGLYDETKYVVEPLYATPPAPPPVSPEVVGKLVEAPRRLSDAADAVAWTHNTSEMNEAITAAEAALALVGEVG